MYRKIKSRINLNDSTVKVRADFDTNFMISTKDFRFGAKMNSSRNIRLYNGKYYFPKGNLASRLARISYSLINIKLGLNGVNKLAIVKTKDMKQFAHLPVTEIRRTRLFSEAKRWDKVFSTTPGSSYYLGML